jgi:hypothetical protein
MLSWSHCSAMTRGKMFKDMDATVLKEDKTKTSKWVLHKPEALN